MIRSAAALFALWALPAAAQAPLWLASCSNQGDAGVLTCEIAQSIVLTEGNRRVATAAFARPAGDTALTGIYTLPVGLFLPSGLTLSVDDEALGTVEFQSCDAQGCYATAPVSEALETALRAGETLVMTIERPDRQPVNFSFPLEGFAASQDLLP